MMASLRVRLVACVLALSAVGLIVLGAITYLEQRSFLIDRIDQQARSASGPVSAALAGRELSRPPPGRLPGERGPPPAGAPGVDLPPGTYGERRDGDGDVVGSPIVLTYGQRITARPKLPDTLPTGHLLTVDGADGAGTRYRVLATPDRRSGSGTIVVALPLKSIDQTLDRLLIVEGIVIAGVLLILGLAAWGLMRVGLAPLDRMGRTAGSIAGGNLSRRVTATDPRSEVGRLGIALNAMLDRLEQAFSRQRSSEEHLRRFLADASHELRTPLASIRGYAELFRIGAASTPAEIEKAMRRIEQEATRMGVLVDDLLTLAHLDETHGGEHEAVDVGALARDAVHDARAAAPERRIDVHVQGPATTIGNPDQLHQVLGNLLRNALTHTPAAAAVEVTVDGRDDGVRLEVRDHGPGLPPSAEPDAIFERFWRAEAGRERGRGGAGLGLAIVAGIVRAHGGRVDARDAAGGGAAFVIQLPAAQAAARLAPPAG